MCVCVCVGGLDNTVIASKTGPETINRDSSLEQPLFLFVELCSFFFNENSNYSYRNGNGAVTGKCTDLELFQGSDDRDTCTVIYLREFK